MLRRIAATACVIGCLSGGAAAAQGASWGERLAVFPKHGVNVPEETARAATELLVSSLRDERIAVAELDAAAPASAPAPTPVPPLTGAAPASGPQLVDHATPPPFPGMAAFAPGGEILAAASSATEPSAQEKIAIARGLGCTGYVDGDLVRLGTEIRVTVSKRDLSGAALATRDASVRSDDALATAVDAIARALVGDQAADAALARGKAAAIPGVQQRGRVAKSFGAVIGGMFGVADTMDLGMVAAFDARFEVGQFLGIVNAGIGMASPDKYDLYSGDRREWDYDDDYTDENGDHPTDQYDISDQPPGMEVWVSADAAAYLTRGSVAPYLGAGFGMFLGGRVHAKARKDLDGDPANGDDASRYWDSTIGLDLHPTLGIEFLRRSEIHLHLEARYTCNFSVGGEFGHGPIILAGVDF